MPPKTLYSTLWERSTESSANYVSNHLSRALLFPDKKRFWTYAASKASSSGLWAEFGVFSGDSINHFANLISYQDGIIFGFDSFEGLKEDWHGTDAPQGMFNMGGKLPQVLQNVRLIPGWFDVSLPRFLEEKSGPFSFIHCDADTYESTGTILSNIGNRITTNTVLVFDEYLNYPNWENGEFKAWQEFCANNSLHYQYLGFCESSAVVKIQ
jgi:hypothetical protein